MDQRIVSAVAEASKSTFRDMFGIEASFQGARELAPSEEHGWELTGLVGLAGKVQGVIAVRLTETLAARLLAGSGVDTADEGERRQLEGGLVGELCNIVAGAASSSGGLDFEIAPPVVVRGPNHKIGWPNLGPVASLVFELGAEGGFEVDVCAKL
jgi:CheY-specific phosphatase CheX